MSPSLSEFARRLLRNEGVELLVPKKNALECERIPNLVAEHIPSRLQLPEIILHDEELVVLLHNRKEIGRLSGTEPNLESVWVNGEVSKLLEMLLELVEVFLEAGYPGCRDCLGPAASEPWDEMASRTDSAQMN